MKPSKGKESLFDEMIDAIEKIREILSSSGEDSSEYRGLEKIINIAKNRDPSGVKNIFHYLNGDSRIIYDNRVYNDEIEKLIEKAYSIADRL